MLTQFLSSISIGESAAIWAIESIITIKEESDIDSLFSVGETTALYGDVKGLNDFELITFLIIR